MVFTTRYVMQWGVKEGQTVGLGGTLLTVHEIQLWITRHHEQEREHSTAFLDAVPVPTGHALRAGAHGGIIPDPPIAVGMEHPAGRMQFTLLEYGIPEDRWVRKVPVAHGGVLASLHALSTMLAQRYQWQPAQATVFVLTGLPPALRTIDVDWMRVHIPTAQGSITALSRLVLTLDPTLSPKQVSVAFQAVRQRLLGTNWRDVNEKQLALARFVLQRASDEPWEQRMATWNTECPTLKWAYPNKQDLGHFKRDCQHAIEKLLAPISL